MIDNSVVKNLFLDMLKFMISVMALCWSVNYFLEVAYSYAVEGSSLLVAFKYNFTSIYLLWVAGLAAWLTIEEKGLAFATSLILFTSDYFGRLLGYRMFENLFIINEIAVRITTVFVAAMLVLGYLSYRYRDGDIRLIHYLILAVCTVFLSCINDAGFIASWLPMFEVAHVKDFMIGMYIPCSAGLLYFFEVTMYDEVFYVDSSN